MCDTNKEKNLRPSPSDSQPTKATISRFRSTQKQGVFCIRRPRLAQGLFYSRLEAFFTSNAPFVWVQNCGQIQSQQLAIGIFGDARPLRVHMNEKNKSKSLGMRRNQRNQSISRRGCGPRPRTTGESTWEKHQWSSVNWSKHLSTHTMYTCMYYIYIYQSNIASLFLHISTTIDLRLVDI